MAVNLPARRFAVADGMGGYGFDKLGTGFFAQYLASYAAKFGIDPLLDSEKAAEIFRSAETVFAEFYSRFFDSPPAFIRGSKFGKVGSTLTYVEFKAGSVMRIVCIGDSPAFLLGEPNIQYGEDSQVGSVDMPIANFFGVSLDGRPVVPQKGIDKFGRKLVDCDVQYNPGELVALGTDYFSESDPKSFLGLDAHNFGQRVEASGKVDDASLIVINPKALYGRSET
ncbi:hypothetical protein [Mycolicibacterium cosmeticum]|uniref:hypothetical protein n=1 Tax=Mycolicibacterium cosmeticum TaxID=258533 RepID=UPI0032049578